MADTTCPYCGQTTHNGMPWASVKCPLVKSFTYNADNTIASIEFFDPAQATPVAPTPAPALPPQSPPDQPLGRRTS